jgi:hypothetical protein
MAIPSGNTTERPRPQRLSSNWGEQGQSPFSDKLGIQADLRGQYDYMSGREAAKWNEES